MDWSAEKIDIAKFGADEINFTFEEVQEYKAEEVSAPLRGVLTGLLLSLPIWAVGFILFKIF